MQPPSELVWGVRLRSLLPKRARRVHPGVEVDLIAEQWLTASRTAVMRANANLERLLAAWVDYAMPGHTPAQKASLAEKRVRRAESAAAQRVGADFGVDEMARVAGYSRCHFSTLYRRLRGRSVREFLKDLRLDAAKGYLADTDMSVAAIAQRLGYSTPAAFVRMFRSQTGRRPTAWRRRRTKTKVAGVGW
jgi:AraC-like DNA-binding protein